jgi:hypothetical protein
MFFSVHILPKLTFTVDESHTELQKLDPLFQIREYIGASFRDRVRYIVPEWYTNQVTAEEWTLGNIFYSFFSAEICGNWNFSNNLFLKNHFP